MHKFKLVLTVLGSIFFMIIALASGGGKDKTEGGKKAVEKPVVDEARTKGLDLFKTSLQKQYYSARASEKFKYCWPEDPNARDAKTWSMGFASEDSIFRKANKTGEQWIEYKFISLKNPNAIEVLHTYPNGTAENEIWFFTKPTAEDCEIQ